MGGAGGAPVSPPIPPACEGDLCDSPLRIVRISENNPVCFVRASGKAVCIGGSFAGEPGPNDSLPHEQENVENAVAASGMLEQMCFLLATGEVSCRGWSHHGQLGLAVPISDASATPLLLPQVEGLVQLSSGHHHVCGRRGGGDVLCWGGPYSPSLGAPGVSQTQAPVAVQDLTDAIHVAASVESVCAVKSTGKVACWGWLPLGNGSDTPAEVEGIDGAVAIVSGWGTFCARLATGEVACFWIDGLDVTKVVGLTDAEQVVSTDHSSCARRTAGEVVCWTTGSLAKGDPPVTVNVSGVIDLAAGPSNVCALTASGKVLCWTGETAPQEVLGLYP